MVPDHQVRRKWSGDASKKVQLFKVGGSRIIGTAVMCHLSPCELCIHLHIFSTGVQLKIPALSCENDRSPSRTPPMSLPKRTGKTEITPASVVHWDPILGSQLGIWDGNWDPNVGSQRWDGIFGPFRVHCSAIHTRNRKVVIHPILVS